MSFNLKPGTSIGDAVNEVNDLARRALPATIGTSFQGGPLLNSKGEVFAVASRTYAPLNFATDAVFFAAPIRDACNKVLRCPSGEISGAGQPR